MPKVTYQCAVTGCGFITCKKADLRDHSISVHNIQDYTLQIIKPTLTCEAPDCNYVASKLSQLIIHRRKHSGVKPFKCDHAGCDYAATQMCNLKAHMRKHTGIRYIHT